MSDKTFLAGRKSENVEDRRGERDEITNLLLSIGAISPEAAGVEQTSFPGYDKSLKMFIPPGEWIAPPGPDPRSALGYDLGMADLTPARDEIGHFLETLPPMQLPKKGRR